MKFLSAIPLLPLGLALLGLAQAVPAPAAKVSLRPSYGGAVLEGRIYVPNSDNLVTVWSGAGHARLMKCSPVCSVIPAIPLKGTLIVNNGSAYRIALGGQFRVGQKVAVTLRFRNQGVLIIQAIVTKP